MRRVFVAVGMVCVLALCPYSSAWSGEIDLSRWAYVAPVKLESPVSKGAAQFALTPEAIDLCMPSLQDLRLVVNQSVELGYVVREARSRKERRVLPCKVYNRVFQPGQHSSVTLDFEGKLLKNAIEIRTPGNNFRRKVRVEGCDDGLTWQVVRDAAFLFRAGAGEQGEQQLEKNVVQFPDNDYRYLKATVFNSPDDPEVIKIEEVTSWQLVETAPETAPVPVVSARTEEKTGLTEIFLDLGFRNMPLHVLQLSFSDRNFCRHADISGRNSETQIVKTVVEDSPKLEKAVPVPWNSVAKDTIYRFTTEGGVDESLTVGLNGSKFRYLRVRIRNQNDPPLQFIGASASRLTQRVWFAPKSDGDYALYCGNHSASRPEYDVVSYVDRLQQDGISRANLGKVTANPAHREPTKVIPWSERHRALIWVALVAMLAIMGLLVFRMVASVKKP